MVKEGIIWILRMDFFSTLNFFTFRNFTSSASWCILKSASVATCNLVYKISAVEPSLLLRDGEKGEMEVREEGGEG